MVKNVAGLGLVVALLAAAAPAAAGTLYLPVVSPDQPAGGTFKTRVWLTNYGDAPASVKLLYLPGAGDGTRQRGNPEARTVPPGATIVLFDEAGHGLLEVQAPDRVAVSAELRNTDLAGPREVFGAVPVVGSHELTRAGGTLVLQGLRRTRAGVRSHLGFMNLGHEAAACSAALYSAVGDELVGATGLPLAPLSHALVQDVLDLVKHQQIGDVNARISCDQPFYGYVGVQEEPTGEIVFLRPSPTGASTLAPPGSGEPGPGPSPSSHVFTRPGTFHTPTRGNETKVFNIKVPASQSYRKVVLEVDVTPGAWYAPAPDKAHNLFWLHRGGCCWPRWKENVIGFADAFGPAAHRVKVSHNLAVPERPYPKVRAGARLERGKPYRVRYEYDAAGGKVRLRLSSGGKVLVNASGRARVSRIHPASSGEFMAYFGHDRPPPKCLEAKNCGPEKPTYGWKYSNLRVEFIP